jgi:hypothetical protein
MCADQQASNLAPAVLVEGLQEAGKPEESASLSSRQSSYSSKISRRGGPAENAAVVVAMDSPEQHSFVHQAGTAANGKQKAKVPDHRAPVQVSFL